MSIKGAIKNKRTSRTYGIKNGNKANIARIPPVNPANIHNNLIIDLFILSSYLSTITQRNSD